MEKRVRIIDIAEELGLSTATVSNVIHGKTKKISDETVKRVQQLLEEKEYIPNMAGILLAQNSSRIIGVIINNHEKYEGNILEDAFIASSLNALEKVLGDSGYFMMVKVTGEWNGISRIASMWNMEGLVLIGFCEQDYKKLRENMHIPFVVYDGYFEGESRICNLIIDSYGGGYQVGRYLKAMGHRRVLCLSDNFICMDKERMDGCIAGMSGCQVDLLQIPLLEEQREAFYRERLPEIMEYTAVFAMSDFYAIELLQVLQMHGKRVPKDISVVGFDDAPWCEKIYPPLTTVRQDAMLRAQQAVSILKEMKNGVYEKKTVKLPVQLIERRSVKRIIRQEENLI